MHVRGPLPLALRDAPAAVLLVQRHAGASPRLVAADAGALALAGGSLPADLAAWCRAAGFSAGEGPWGRLADGERLGGVLLPDHLWLTATPAGGDRVLVALQHLETPPATPGAGDDDVVTASPGMALSERGPEAGATLTVTWAGPGYARATGRSAADVVGQPVRALVPAGDEASLAELADGLERAEPVAVTVLDRRSDGTSFLHRVGTSPLLDATGRAGHVVSWHADVTGRVAAEAGLRAAQEAGERTAARLELLRRLDEVVVADDVAAGLQAVVDVLGEHVVADALVLLTVARPGGPRGVDAELAAAAGPVLAPLTGRRLRRATADGADDPLLRVALSGAVHPLTPPVPDPQEATTASGWVAAMVAAVTATPALAVPLLGRDQVVGLLVVLPRDGALSEDAAAVVVSAARRAGLLVETARSHAREHALAETLQRSMLPQQASVDGLDVWTYYAPNVDRAQVGGDWYDVLQTAPDVAAVVVGDVVGHDVEAVAAMGQIRSVVRSYAHELDDPGSVLMRVDQLASGMRIPRMASLVYAMLSRLDDGEWELSWSSAGHLPPLLRRGGAGAATVEVLSDGTGTLVGLGSRPRPTRDRSLSPGDVLVLYTDGLIETRERAMRDGLGVLVGVLEQAGAADAAGIGEELLTALGESPDDDTAVVVVRIPDQVSDVPTTAADTPRRRRWQLPSEPSSIGKARHATLRACAVWGLGCGPQAEIVVSELVANAVLHGWGTVGLRLFETPEGLRIEVEDDSPEAPRVVDARPDGSGGHGMRVVARLGRWGWQPTRKGKIVWVELAAAGL
ncbi:ATP-binding SpoIIE family protein phosphatase [Kineococcus rubinsiae]|uniref:ATP-binding SpoIIE family protein phosphatase n=1 Tax=Kineococcus rubinsiae TaxID=2609562 RepID=UPI0014319A11|nr:SpoIIE family protein phosphatase [Kineococcus rubinsiae]NIZ90584.1 SpoIIE family protein phosphatase [Kineococcus rubinsiae]